MKFNNITKKGTTFITGLVIGILTVISSGFITGGQSQAELQTVDLNEATRLTGNYTSSATPMNEIFKGFAVNIEMLDAMKSLYEENNKFIGFRVYMSADNKGVASNILVGINEAGKDATGNTIYLTSASSGGPCPTNCDSSSPL